MENERKIEQEAGGFPTWSNLLVIVALFFAGSLVAAIVMAVLRLAWADAPKEFLTAIMYATQFGLAIWWVWLYGRRRGARSAFNFTFRWYNSTIVLLGLVLMLAGSVVLEPLLGLFPDKYFDMMNEAIGSGGWAILTAVVLAPVCEEMLFRGLILEYIKQKRGVAVAVVLSALIFGLVHAPILPQMVNAFVLGIMLGYVYVLTGSLVSVIIVHAANNALSYLIMELTGGQSAELRDILGNDPLFWTIFGASVVVFIGAVVAMALVATKNRHIEGNINR
ncbi:MAG: CPBP family intramembrane metalloprotease [Rikenellaceae bacterium]|jgi:membrane protease YdiL (CAAX protease family)|nr:CPBP family intramembrane metalloprotease [Rikenellaceae bacterium]